MGLAAPVCHFWGANRHPQALGAAYRSPHRWNVLRADWLDGSWIEPDDISGEGMEPGFDAAVAETAKHVAWRVGDLRMFDDPERQDLLEVARRLRVAGVEATAVPPLDGSLTPPKDCAPQPSRLAPLEFSRFRAMKCRRQ